MPNSIFKEVEEASQCSSFKVSITQSKVSQRKGVTPGRGKMSPQVLQRQISKAIATPTPPPFSCDLNRLLKQSWALGQGVSHGQRRPVSKVWLLCLPVGSNKCCRPPPADNIEIHRVSPRTLAALPLQVPKAW